MVVKLAENRYLFLAHMQRGSVVVKVSDTVKRAQPLDKCGNSGNSEFAHIHLHIQDTPTLNVGRGQNPIFSAIDIELNGMRIGGDLWLLTRGTFVSNKP